VQDMSIGKQEAFEIFKRDYSENAAIEEQKKLLKKNYAEAKIMGESINVSRNKISKSLVNFEFLN
jgi:kinesin family protein 6/9